MVFQRLKDLREDNDLLQKDIALHLNIKQNTYSQYETGALNIPIEILIKLANYYNTSVDYLMDRTNTSIPYKDTIIK